MMVDVVDVVKSVREVFEPGENDVSDANGFLTVEENGVIVSNSG